uniref:non-specific serine/threonine protein kinase n=2 Tax=Kalmanozyma brasiliensis (strain GHG001) TaxID=1365824 RepID=V5E8T2_KALBG
MTPRRPVPTKSYFAEKARQLAELASEEDKEAQLSERSKGIKAVRARPRKTIATAGRGNSRKSMAAKPRQTSALGYSLNSAIAISDSSMSSATGVSDSSFDAAGTSQSSISFLGQSSDESRDLAAKSSIAAAKAKAKQNKRVTRRIAATSDDEDEVQGGSEDESEQDPALQLAAAVADLAVADEDDATAIDDHLDGLLAAVSQAKPKAFSTVIQQLRASKASTSQRRLEKIGEASYSEVFKISSSRSNTSADSDRQEALVLKIIPISSSSISNNDNEDLPYTSPAADVEREIRLMQLIGREASVADSFVSLRAVHVVRGAYPAPLLQAWDRWDAKRRVRTGEGAENIRPHVLGRQQVYALLVMTDGGMDLESLKLRSWSQAASIFRQVAIGLGKMETKYEFEHRDLHWGNILVQAVATTSQAHDDGGGLSWLLDPSASGVKATIIDFTLSRARTSPVTAKRSKSVEVLHYPFDDESLFEGSGGPQFDVYREMRTVTKDSWAAHCPATNVLWLRYLVHKLIEVKCRNLKVPKGSDADAQRELRSFDVLQKAAARLDEAAQTLLNAAPPKRGPVAGRKPMHPRARKSVLPAATIGARKGRATMMVTPLQPAESETKAVRSAADLVSFLD